jgi:hypothetical protein
VVPATGVAHFERALAGFREAADIHEIVIVAISDDFFRPLWRPMSGPDGIRMCAPDVTDEQCAGQYPFAQAIGADDSQAALLARAADVRRRFAPEASFPRTVLQHSDLLRFLKRMALAARTLARRREFEPSVDALRRIRERFSAASIRMVHVPDRYETEARRYLVDLASSVESLGIDYFPVLSRCPIPAGMYYPNDNHPTTEGYRHLAACVTGYLESPPNTGPVSR